MTRALFQKIGRRPRRTFDLARVIYSVERFGQHPPALEAAPTSLLNRNCLSKEKPVNRPARKLKNLEEKIAQKASRAKSGRKARAWKKAVEAFKPLAG